MVSLRADGHGGNHYPYYPLVHRSELGVQLSFYAVNSMRHVTSSSET